MIALQGYGWAESWGYNGLDSIISQSKGSDFKESLLCSSGRLNLAFNAFWNTQQLINKARNHLLEIFDCQIPENKTSLQVSQSWFILSETFPHSEIQRNISAFSRNMQLPYLVGLLALVPAIFGAPVLVKGTVYFLGNFFLCVLLISSRCTRCPSAWW
jgi:hypothetical protein